MFCQKSLAEQWTEELLIFLFYILWILSVLLEIIFFNEVTPKYQYYLIYFESWNHQKLEISESSVLSFSERDKRVGLHVAVFFEKSAKYWKFNSSHYHKFTILQFM